MKSYPSIDREVRRKTPIYAFDKADGSQIRAEWSKKAGWYKFGSRNVLLGEDHQYLGKAIDIFKNKYGDDLAKIFLKQHWQQVILFGEFWGPKSFAGLHEKEDAHTVTLFDVNPHKKGILLPQDFMKLFGDLDHAPLLYRGNANQEFEEEVRSGKLEGMTFEGVVCKGAYVSPGLPLMFKIKNRAWIEKLRERCAGDEKLFQQLL